MTDLSLYTQAIFSTQFPVRLFIDENDAPWFCHSDVCEVLGYKNSRTALANHCRAKGVLKQDTPVCDVLKQDGTSKARKNQRLTFINEGNLYRLIVKSRKPEAEQFEEWVFDEVLPQIRKTGKYQVTENTISAKHLKAIKEAVANCTRYMKHESMSLAQVLYRNMKKEFNVEKTEDLPEDKIKDVMAASRLEKNFIKLLKQQDYEKAAEINTDLLSTYKEPSVLLH